jgi:DNA-binding MarR family transcriptional regulator
MSTDLDISACAGCLGLASRKAARAITAAYDRRLRRYGVRATQYTLLVMLALRGGLPMGELARYLGLDRTTLSRNLALLEDNGWAASRPDERDARSRIVTITEAGRAKVTEAFPAWRETQDKLLEVFGEPGVAALRALATTKVQ